METYKGFSIGDRVLDPYNKPGVVTGFKAVEHRQKDEPSHWVSVKADNDSYSGGWFPDSIIHAEKPLEETLELSKAVVGTIKNKKGNAIAIKVTEEEFHMSLIEDLATPSVTKVKFSITKEEAPEFINKLKDILGVT